MTLPWHEFLAVWGFLAVNILSPGPNVINTIATAMGGGAKAGLASALGVGLGIGGWCLGMSLGMAAVFAAVPGAQVALTVVALCLLLWFASRYLRSAWAGWKGQRRGLPAALPQDGFRSAFLRSLTVNALNPKALTSWLAVLSIFPVARATGGDIALLWLGTSSVAMAIHTAYALAFATPAAARFYLRAGWAISGAAGIFFSAVAVGLARGLVQNL